MKGERVGWWVRKTMVWMALVTMPFWWTSCAVQSSLIGTHKPATLLQQFRWQLDRILQDSVLQQTRTGIKIVSLETGEVLYQRNSQKLFHPASNMKLLTTAAALKYLGPNYRFRTVLLADSGSVVDSIVKGNLYLKGYGNPDLTTEDLRDIIRELKRRGIRRIDGNLICDASFFDDLYWGKGWMWDDVSSWYFAPISALSVNDNCVTVYVKPGSIPGSPLQVEVEPPTAYVAIDNRGQTVAVEDTSAHATLTVERKWKTPENTIVVEGTLPVGAAIQKFVIDVVNAPLYVGTLFKELLLQDSVAFRGQVLRGVAPENAVPLVTHFSDPLTLVIYNTNKISDNLSAEMILKTLAAEVKGEPGTAAHGVAIIREYLNQLGVDSATYQIVDGSGVSRYNLITPDLMIALLQDMYRDFRFQAEFQTSLPIAGVDGTLSDRMRGTPAQGILRAKTGTLSGVSALAGYTTTADGEPVAFSIIMEHFVGSAARVRAVQDRIGSAISAFSRKHPWRVQYTDHQSQLHRGTTEGGRWLSGQRR
ncbi:MAG: D-alanyl-D-alanine carboxypeptidase/D-alanyl-D-alanine-endopeptidase [Calditrichaeota bacterium]|nr:D-alanyl-D-alanine carboxypeptidase/D-alanyl-D-alanine-endopeptidase [Calditrichota bacterium]